MKRFNSTPREMLASCWRHRVLIFVLAKRELLSRYRGSILGLLWSFFHPLFMLVIYTFVFSMIFKARWNSASDSKTEFALILFAGLIIFNLFSECISRAPTLILSNVNYVKKVIFPLEILPWVSLSVALFQLLMSLTVWLIFYTIICGMPHNTLLLLPIILLPILLIIIGTSWILASLGVYLRDAGQIIGILLSILMFLSPIFYPKEALPREYQYLLLLNPLTPGIEAVRDILYWNHLPQIKIYGIYLLSSILFAWLGFFWFQKTRKGFADVL